MISSLSIGPRTLLNDCNLSATATFWRPAIFFRSGGDLRSLLGLSEPRHTLHTNKLELSGTHGGKEDFLLNIAQKFHVTQCFGGMSHCHLSCTLTSYLMLSHVFDFGGTLQGMSSGRLARCMVRIFRGCERVCSWPVRPPPADVRGVCMHAGSGGVCGC